MNPKITELKNRLTEINDIESAANVLQWDQSTYMPEGGAPARGRQLATLGKLAHEMFVSSETGKLLEACEKEINNHDKDSDEAALLRVTRRDYDKATKLSADFMKRALTHFSESYNAWHVARPKNDFKSVQPFLEKGVELSREYSSFFKDAKHVADPLIDSSDPGMRADSVRKVFAGLRENLVPLVKTILDKQPPRDDFMSRTYPESAQLDFSNSVIRKLGYSFERGRQDKTHHPFMIRFSGGDVRITVRAKENDPSDLLFSAIHEAGHAMYEQGISAALDGTPLGSGASSGVHESQSRLWENLVGRSREFWQYFYPQLKKTFPEQLADVEEEAFYKGINKVSRSLIRTDADEVTYNLHVMIRFDLELDLLEGKLAVKDLPEAWHARYQSDLGVRAPDDRDGCLQDVHWFAGFIGGAFQGYTIGNMLAAQVFESAWTEQPSLKQEIARGEFDPLRKILTNRLYQHGRKYLPDDLIVLATGKPLSHEPFMRYLKSKYSKIYGF